MSFFLNFNTNRSYEVYGPHGGISTVLTLPDSFDSKKDKCALVILMHGFIAKKDLYPLPTIAESLSKAGIASIRFDFNAHGKSEGKFIDMTISSEIEDAKSVLEYARSLPFVTKIALLGHSQGGVVAGMLAGEMENIFLRPDCLVLLAPAAVLKDDAIAGKCMYAKYDASNPPESVSVFFHKLGRNFIIEAQKLPVYETSSAYTGPVLIIHGDNDSIVPVSYSEKYFKLYKDSELCVLQGEGHMLNGNKKRLMEKIVGFLKINLG